MAPLIRLVALFSIFASVIASPHFSRNAYNHAHRAIAHPPVQADPSPLSVPRRQRSLNKRCLPRPSNSTSTSPSSTPNSSPTPLNVVPLPSSSPTPTPSLPPSDYSSSSSSSSTSSSSSYSSPSPSPTPDTPAPSPSPSTSTSSTPTPSPSSSSSYNSGEPSYMTGTQSGQGTWYDAGLGACGITNTNTDYIAAVSHLLFDSYPGYDGVNPNTNPVCNKVIEITDPTSGGKATVTVTDRCTACQLTDLDLTPTAFQNLANPSEGRIQITWNWQ